MKEILRKISTTLGYHILPIDNDPIQKMLIETYRTLRFTGVNSAERGILLSKNAFAEHLRQLLARYKISTVIDVGANKGQFGLLLRGIGFRGKIHSFEPMPTAFESTLKKAQQNGPWKVYPFALGSFRGESELQILADDTCSSLHKVKRESLAEFGAGFEVKKAVRVQVETLDHLFPQIISSPSDEKIFLKTDTQGNDLEVFKGGHQALRQVLVILTEVATQVVYENAPDFLEILKHLDGSSFIPSGFYPFCHRPDNLSLVELDAFFVRKRSKEAPLAQKAG
jgi:FkbM family methyltransferase